MDGMDWEDKVVDDRKRFEQTKSRISTPSAKGIATTIAPFHLG